MLSDCVEPGRRNMTISVTVMGVALLTVLMAYLVFGDNNDQEGLATLRLIGIVSTIYAIYYLLDAVKHNEFPGISSWQQIPNGIISKRSTHKLRMAWRSWFSVRCKSHKICVKRNILVFINLINFRKALFKC